MMKETNSKNIKINLSTGEIEAKGNAIELIFVAFLCLLGLDAGTDGDLDILNK